MKNLIRDILFEFYRNRKKFDTLSDRTFIHTEEIYDIAIKKIEDLIKGEK